jgi:hypothetical protein
MRYEVAEEQVILATAVSSPGVSPLPSSLPSRATRQPRACSSASHRTAPTMSLFARSLGASAAAGAARGIRAAAVSSLVRPCATFHRTNTAAHRWLWAQCRLLPAHQAAAISISPFSTTSGGSGGGGGHGAKKIPPEDVVAAVSSDPMDVFYFIDSDGSGKISQAEFSAAIDKLETTELRE